MTIALDLSQQRKETAEAWSNPCSNGFQSLRALEEDAPGPFAPEAPARDGSPFRPEPRR